MYYKKPIEIGSKENKSEQILKMWRTKFKIWMREILMHSALCNLNVLAIGSTTGMFVFMMLIWTDPSCLGAFPHTNISVFTINIRLRLH